jgi:thiamine biosynthesis lipoprotein
VNAVVDPLRQKYGSRAAILLPLLLVSFVALSAWRMWPSGQQRPAATIARSVDFGGPTMGTTWRVTVITGGADTSQVQGALERELLEIDRQMSNYRDDSVLAAFNAHAGVEPFPAPPALLTVVDTAAKISAASGGAFDVTVAPLVDAWGFGRVKREDARPSDEELAARRARVGWQKVHVDMSAGTLRKDQPDVVLDLSAIAPGYAADVLSDRLVALGFPDHLVDVGGEFRARGEGPGGAWRVGVERPDGPLDERAVQEVVPLRDAALATSGDYRNYREQDGRRISHTIDPRTGRPIAHRLASVTVVADNAALADGWATALNVLGPEEGLALAERERLPALFLVREAGGFIPHATAAFAGLRASGPSANLTPR